MLGVMMTVQNSMIRFCLLTKYLEWTNKLYPLHINFWGEGNVV
jgi:hypothetical protein